MEDTEYYEITHDIEEDTTDNSGIDALMNEIIDNNEASQDYQTIVQDNIQNIYAEMQNLKTFNILSMVSLGIIIGILLAIILQNKVWR